MNIKTKLHTYFFDVSKATDKAAYAELCERLKAQGIKPFISHGGKGHYLPFTRINGSEIELETKHVFDNQWNTAPIPGFSEQGWRVFDWAEDSRYAVNANPDFKRGHYLDQVPAMIDVRANTVGCGYCGKQEPLAKGLKFCPHCIGSEYLKETDLFLTRMVPICNASGNRAPLTESEQAELHPLYVHAQIHGNTERDKARLAKQRADIINKAGNAIANATDERDGLLWLMDNGMKTDNVIYYNHTKRFSFGWRKALGASEVSALLEVISEFGFAYDIICDDGRELSGN